MLQMMSYGFKRTMKFRLLTSLIRTQLACEELKNKKCHELMLHACCQEKANKKLYVWSQFYISSCIPNKDKENEVYCMH